MGKVNWGRAPPSGASRTLGSRARSASGLSSLILISFLERQGLAWTCGEDGCRWKRYLDMEPLE